MTPEEVNSMKSILLFSTETQPELNQVGGKALALIQMTKAGMPVPPGFVLAVNFFKPWMDILQKAPQWVAMNNVEIGEMGQTARALQTLCRTLTFTDTQKEELELTLKFFREENNGHL
ncbi:MAG: hypothetical protein HGA53_07770, partial [Anaerolineaceae bacterium]|nr:hypothetical protein [Anaerolineaceae bacterium]